MHSWFLSPVKRPDGRLRSAVWLSFGFFLLLAISIVRQSWEPA
jgi:hypothetical protein